MKVAFVYDRINKWGGGEQVLLALHEIWPDAPLVTSVYDEEAAKWAKVFDVRTSFIQQLPIPKGNHEKYPFLMGSAFESFNFDAFDVVISITSEFAKAIITKPQTLHICYCLNPVGYLWSGYGQYFSNKSAVFRALTMPLVKYLRWYDKIVCHRPDKYVAISQVVADRINQYYGLPSEVVYPPVEISKSQITNAKSQNEEYYLVVARLVPNKRIDLAIEAFNQLGLNLKIVGVGKEEENLKSLAKTNVEFLGNLTREQLANYYRSCKALIVPAEEDFGIVSVEAQSFGKPVVAFGRGGSLETVVQGTTGWFFQEPTPESLVAAIQETATISLKPDDCKKNAGKFAAEKFRAGFKSMIDREYQKYLITTR